MTSNSDDIFTDVKVYAHDGPSLPGPEVQYTEPSLNFRTVRVCDRCKREHPYDGPWVKLDFIKGHKTLSSEMACWGCFLDWGRLSK